jgi:hypothetical protein
LFQQDVAFMDRGLFVIPRFLESTSFLFLLFHKNSMNSTEAYNESKLTTVIEKIADDPSVGIAKKYFLLVANKIRKDEPLRHELEKLTLSFSKLSEDGPPSFQEGETSLVEEL